MIKQFGLVTLILGAWLTSVAMAQDNLSVVLAYKTDTAPTIDGLIGAGEWDAAGPPIVVARETEGWNPIPDDPFGGPGDLSYQFRVMWEEPWTAYFLVEVTDDIAMDENPAKAWERDMVSMFIDGDDLEGSDDLPSFQWWDGAEIYGKFAVSRWGEFEGNSAVMSDSVDDMFADEFGSFIAVAGQATETGHNGDYIAEYAVSFEAMSLHGTFDGTETESAGQIVQDSTVVKWALAVDDDDNFYFADDDTERSSSIGYFTDPGDADWRDTAAFPNLTFVGPYNPDGGLQLKAGDADMDLDFDQFDLIKVQVAAKYLSGQPATWGEGDWNGAPGGSVGSPPQGNALFDQLDIIAALGAGTYLKGPYAALAQGSGSLEDDQTSIVYNVGTGELSVDAPAGTELTSVNIDSAAGIFTGAPAENLGGSFDNDVDNNIFKATFGGSFGSISFGTVAQAGLSEEFVRGDLTVVGSLNGGGDLGNVDLVYIPEPSALVLLALGLVGLVGLVRRGRCG